jgi:hypothetical protein
MVADLIEENSAARIGVPYAGERAQLMRGARRVLSIPTAIMQEKEFKASCRSFSNSMRSLLDAATVCAPNCAPYWSISLRHRKPLQV